MVSMKLQKHGRKSDVIINGLLRLLLGVQGIPHINDINLLEAALNLDASCIW